ncbi:sensor histidine kinase [Dyadobacter sp. 3J3]|uniref:sensor histidine kinase n=1 Tax=Dyadobacter sp. 3J3 TaxID=2606600 RepID=UPI00135951D4|nr:sensor histidine kinase [Dyadobacter sp. 3J3]
MYKYITICFLFLAFLKSNAQDQTAATYEELLRKVKTTKPDTARIISLLDLGNYFLLKPNEYQNDLDSAFKYFEMANLLGQRLGLPDWENRSKASMMGYYLEKKEYQKSTEIFKAVTEYFRKNGEKYREAVTLETYARQMGFDRTRPDILIEIIGYHERARKLFFETNQLESAIDILRGIADIHMQQGKLDQAEQELFKVVAEFKKFKIDKLQYPYDMLAEVNYRRGDQPKELMYRLLSLKYTAVTNSQATDKYWRYVSLAHLYLQLNQSERALYFANKTLTEGKVKTGDMVYYCSLLYAVDALLAQRKFKYAYTFLKDHQLKAKNSLEAGIYLNQAMGNYYTAVKKYGTAEDYFLKSLYYYELDDKAHVNRHLYAQEAYTIGHFYILAKRFKNAGYYLKQIEFYPSQILPPIQQAKINFELFQVDSALGNYVSAIKHFQLHKKINDSLFTATKVRQLDELQVKYESSRKAHEIKSLYSQSQVQQLKLQKVNKERDLILLGLLMFAITSALAYKGYRDKQNSNQIILKSNELILNKNAQLQHLLTEKEWLLKEVHHRVKNNLHMVICLLESQAAYLENDALKALELSQHRIYTISLIHQKLYQSEDIKSVDMSSYLAEFIPYLIDCFQTKGKIHFDLDIEPIQLSPTQALPVALIINEAVTNSIKYAFQGKSKGNISIALSQFDNDIILELADNGVGINLESAHPSANSLGLKLIKGLSEDINAQISFNNSNGTLITVVFQRDTLLENAMAI